MKIGARISFFNLALRARRIALGYRTQADLAQAARLAPSFVQKVESLVLIEGKLQSIADKLQRIAHTLDCDFDELFPPDYLELLEKANLPQSSRPFIWQREVYLSELPPSTQVLQLPSAEETMLEDEQPFDLAQAVQTCLAELSEKESHVLVLRYGLGSDTTEMTLKEVAQAMGISLDRVRQIESKALQHLGSPIFARQLRPFLNTHQEG